MADPPATFTLGVAAEEEIHFVRLVVLPEWRRRSHLGSLKIRGAEVRRSSERRDLAQYEPSRIEPKDRTERVPDSVVDAGRVELLALQLLVGDPQPRSR